MVIQTIHEGGNSYKPSAILFRNLYQNPSTGRRYSDSPPGVNLHVFLREYRSPGIIQGYLPDLTRTIDDHPDLLSSRIRFQPPNLIEHRAAE